MPRKKPGEGQTALVTGASAGIGVDIAECFARDGYDLILTARSEAPLREVATRLAGAHGVKAHVLAQFLQRDERSAQQEQRDQHEVQHGQEDRKDRAAPGDRERLEGAPQPGRAVTAHNEETGRRIVAAVHAEKACRRARHWIGFGHGPAIPQMHPN